MMKELFSSGVIKLSMYRYQRPLEDYSIASLENLAVVGIDKEVGQDQFRSELDKLQAK